MVVSKGKLKARMLEYFREVERTGEPLIVTDHGREVLEIRPVGGKGRSTAEVLAKLRADLFGERPGEISEEELMAPVDFEEADDSWWTQTKGDARP